MLDAYGPTRTNQALDRLAADVEASPDRPAPTNPLFAAAVGMARASAAHHAASRGREHLVGDWDITIPTGDVRGFSPARVRTTITVPVEIEIDIEGYVMDVPATGIDPPSREAQVSRITFDPRGVLAGIRDQIEDAAGEAFHEEAEAEDGGDQ